MYVPVDSSHARYAATAAATVELSHFGRYSREVAPVVTPAAVQALRQVTKRWMIRADDGPVRGTATAWERLAGTIVEVLRRGIENGGTMFKDSPTAAG